MTAVLTPPTPLATPGEVRRLLGRALVGVGLEVGPGDNPFPLDRRGAEVTYVDQWPSEVNADLFPEVPQERFFTSDHLCDLNVDRLSGFADASQDFVIASHVLEHLVEPIGQMVDMHRVLRPGGHLLVLLPDRRRTFDHLRQPTPLAHLVAEHEQGVTLLDDEHLREFTSHVQEYWADPQPKDEAERFARHRARSIHVHCWHEEEFVEVLEHVVRHLGLGWELVDRVRVEEITDGMEFGFVLRKPLVTLDPDVAADRFLAAWADLGARSARVPAASEQGEQARAEAARHAADVALLQAELERASAVIAHHEKFLAPFRRAGLAAPVRKVLRRG